VTEGQTKMKGFVVLCAGFHVFGGLRFQLTFSTSCFQPFRFLCEIYCTQRGFCSSNKDLPRRRQKQEKAIGCRFWLRDGSVLPQTTDLDRFVVLALWFQYGIYDFRRLSLHRGWCCHGLVYCMLALFFYTILSFGGCIARTYVASAF
jgi:hypothetical protein